MSEFEGFIDVPREIVDSFIEGLTIHIKESDIKYDLIVAPSRGGLIPGVLLSHALAVPLIPILWSTRDNDWKEFPRALEVMLDRGRPMKILLVEDIVDTGKSMDQILLRLRKRSTIVVDVAAIVCNEAIPILYKSVTVDRSWNKAFYNFWWETSHQKFKPIDLPSV